MIGENVKGTTKRKKVIEETVKEWDVRRSNRKTVCSNSPLRPLSPLLIPKRGDVHFHERPDHFTLFRGRYKEKLSLFV